MAAIYSGIHLKLKSRKTPWEEKIKLAHFAWVSHQCFLPNKEQFLLDWVSLALVGSHTRKLSLEADIEQKLWAFLDSILHSKSLQRALNQEKSVNLCFAIAQVINELIAVSTAPKCPSPKIGTILSCLQSVLSSSALAFVYTRKCELLVDLLSLMCSLAYNLISERAMNVQVFTILKLCFVQYLQIQRQRSNSNRVFTHVLTQLFQPFLLLRNALNVYVLDKDSDNSVLLQLRKDIQRNIEVAIQFGLFQVDLLCVYKEELLPGSHKPDKLKEQLKVCLTPVKSILAKLEDSNFCDCETYLSVVATCVPLLCELFLNSYSKNGKMLCFHMLAKLLGFLQSLMLNQENLPAYVPLWTKGLFALEQLLNLLFIHDIYNVAEDRIMHQELQYQFYCKIAEMLLNNPCTFSSSWFHCLEKLILLNHLIVDPHLDKLLSSAWINASLSDQHVWKAQENLIGSLFQVYTKLRQLPKLFQKILEVMYQPVASNLKQPVLSSNLIEKLKHCLNQLHPNQFLDIWCMVMDDCYCVLLPTIKGDPNVCHKLVYIDSFLYCLMFNMKSLDNSTPMPVVSRFQNVMIQMKEKVLLPFLNLMKDHNAVTNPPFWLQQLCDSALFLLYTWIEVDSLTKLNCNKYISQLCISDQLALPSDAWDISIFFQDEECWIKVQRLCTSPVSKICLGLLCIQKMKYTLMQIHSPSESEQLVLNRAASFIVHLGDLEMPKFCKPWSRIVTTIDINCLPVAHWHLIASNIIILLPYTPQQDIRNITNFLIKTKLSALDENNQASEYTLTLNKVSEGLLKSAYFSELHVLQSTFITSIIKTCAIVLSEQAVLSEICLKYLIGYEDFATDDCKYDTLDVHVSYKTSSSSCKAPVGLTNMQKAVRYILSVTKANTIGNVSGSDESHLISVVDLLFMLKPESLTSTDHCRCFLLLLSIASACSSKTLHLASVSYRLLTCLLNGNRVKSLVKLLHAGNILKIVMTHFQSAKWEFDEDTKREPNWLEFIHVIRTFFDTLIIFFVECKQGLFSLEKFASCVVNSVQGTDSKGCHFRVNQLHILVLSSLFYVLSPLIQKENGNEEHMNALIPLLQQAIFKMNMLIQQNLKVCASSQHLPSFLVSCTTILLEIDQSNCNEWDLQNTELYSSVCSLILRKLCYGNEQPTFLKSALCYLIRCVTVKEIYTAQNSLVISTFSSLKKLISRLWVNELSVEEAELELQELLNQMSECSSNEEFCTILKAMLHGFDVSNLLKKRYEKLHAGITLTRLLLNCPLKENKEKLFWFTAPQIMTSLMTVSMEASKDRSLLSSVVVPILDTITLLLRRGEMFLNNPHLITVTFNTLLAIPLDYLKAEEFHKIFLAMHEMLFAILQCYTKVMLRSVSSFLSGFHRLVASIMHEGCQKDKGTICEHILKCTQLLERMYTHIASKTEEFTVFSTFIISQYVQELQKVTLQPVVKKHLTDGIFHILDLCIDRDIKFLNTSLQIGAREVFKELYYEYSHYHKTKSQHEEKYVAL